MIINDMTPSGNRRHLLICSGWFAARLLFSPLLACCQNAPQTRAPNQEVRYLPWKSNKSNMCLRWEGYSRNSKTTTGSSGGQDLKWKESKERLWPQICSGSMNPPQHPSIRGLRHLHNNLHCFIMALYVALDVPKCPNMDLMFSLFLLYVKYCLCSAAWLRHDTATSPSASSLLKYIWNVFAYAFQQSSGSFKAVWWLWSLDTCWRNTENKRLTKAHW